MSTIKLARGEDNNAAVMEKKTAALKNKSPKYELPKNEFPKKEVKDG